MFRSQTSNMHQCPWWKTMDAISSTTGLESRSCLLPVHHLIEHRTTASRTWNWNHVETWNQIKAVKMVDIRIMWTYSENWTGSKPKALPSDQRVQRLRSMFNFRSVSTWRQTESFTSRSLGLECYRVLCWSVSFPLQRNDASVRLMLVDPWSALAAAALDIKVWWWHQSWCCSSTAESDSRTWHR